VCSLHQARRHISDLDVGFITKDVRQLAHLLRALGLALSQTIVFVIFLCIYICHLRGRSREKAIPFFPLLVGFREGGRLKASFSHREASGLRATCSSTTVFLLTTTIYAVLSILACLAILAYGMVFLFFFFFLFVFLHRKMMRIIKMVGGQGQANVSVNIQTGWNCLVTGGGYVGTGNNLAL